MRRAPLLLATGGAFLLLHASAGAVPPHVGPDRRRDEGFTLLEQAARAARELDYRGTQIVSSWSETGSSAAVVSIEHVGGRGMLMRVAPTPQHPGGAVYDDEAGDVPDAIGPGAVELLREQYAAAVEGPGTVAGRPAYVVAVHRPGQPPAARFWIDRQTRLALRREVLDGAGRTVKESAFLDITFGRAQVAPDAVTVARQTPAMNGVPADAGALRADGWHVPERLHTGMRVVDARLDGGTLHLTYADGLSAVSVFQQRGELDHAAVEGWARTDLGAHRVWVQDAFPRRVVWAGAGTVFTVVADCPQATLDDLVGTLPHGNPGPGVTTRLGNGLARVGSWLNPFA